MRDVRRYEVFKRADVLVLRVYEVTRSFPKSELFALTNQTRRAAYSIPMNLAEGAARSTAKEFAQFINVAVGSCEELRYQLHLAQALGYVSLPVQQSLDSEYEEVKRMLSRLLARVSGRLDSDAFEQ
jgi:four helix bundle protein